MYLKCAIIHSWLKRTTLEIWPFVVLLTFWLGLIYRQNVLNPVFLTSRCSQTTGKFDQHKYVIGYRISLEKRELIGIGLKIHIPCIRNTNVLYSFAVRPFCVITLQLQTETL